MQEMEKTREYWSAVFEACRLGEQGEGLEDFLADPWAVLRRHGQESAPECLANGFRPLLPRQAAVARRLAEAWGADGGAGADGEAQDGGKRLEPVRSVHGLVVGWRPFPTRRRAR